MIEQNKYQKVESQIEHLALTDLESSAITILKYVISNQWFGTIFRKNKNLLASTDLHSSGNLSEFTCHNISDIKSMI